MLSLLSKGILFRKPEHAPVSNMFSQENLWKYICCFKKTDKYSHICFVGDNTEQLYCKTSCFAEHSPSAETCFGSSERENYKSLAGNRHCLGKLCSATERWRCRGELSGRAAPCVLVTPCLCPIHPPFYLPAQSEQILPCPKLWIPQCSSQLSKQRCLCLASLAFAPKASAIHLFPTFHFCEKAGVTLINDTILKSCPLANRCDLFTP